jgi:hypothetical protein
MKCACVLACLALSANLAWAAQFAATRKTPMNEVVTLLNELDAKIVADGKA